MNTVPALVLVLFASTAGAAEPKADLKAIGQGRALFRQYCSSCHGLDGKGAGPSAEALKTAPPDLTALAKEGKFDEARVQTWIDGTHAASAHGGRDMPVWGRVLAKSGERPSEGGAQSDIWKLVAYIESIQVPAVLK
jgi:mono/diheme cytochrome c family protein